MVQYICVNSAFIMKDDYFVLLEKKIFTLVFNALRCKYDYMRNNVHTIAEDEMPIFFGWFVLCMCLYVVK